MTRVNSILPGGCVIPPAPVSVKATSNDPALRINVTGDMVSISGTATNNGIVPSTASFQVDGKTISLPLSGGMTGQQVQDLLAAKLPAGYGVQAVPTFAPIEGGGALFRIVREVPKKNDATRVTDAFWKAQTQGTLAGEKVSVRELRKILSEARKDGFTADEKREFAKGWAMTFNGAGFNATRAAQAEYAKLQEKFDLPVFPIR